MAVLLYQNKNSFGQRRVIFNQALFPESWSLKIAHDNEHSYETEAGRKHDGNKEVPLDQVWPTDHATRIVAHVQQLHEDVYPDSNKG